MSGLARMPRGRSSPREVRGGPATAGSAICRAQCWAGLSWAGVVASPAHRWPVWQALPAQPQAAPPAFVSGDKMTLIFQERKRRLTEIRSGAQPPAASVRLPRAAGSLSWALRCDGQGSSRAPRVTGSGERYDPRRRGAGGTGEVAAEEEKQTNTPPIAPLSWCTLVGNSIRRQEARSLSAPDRREAVSRASSPRLPSPCCGLGSLLGPQSRVLAP